MPAFEYEALDLQGRTVSGVLEGDSERAVRARLRADWRMPVSVRVVAERKARLSGVLRAFALRRGASAADLALCTRQFATLIRAGLTVEACLSALLEQTESVRMRSVLAGVRAQVREGQPLSRAMAAFPAAFPDLYRQMVEAGEHSGRLEEVLERLADYTETHEALRRKVALAFVYPVLLTLVASAVVAALLVYVVPQVTRVFANSGQSLPAATRALIAISDLVRHHGATILGALALALVAAQIALRDAALRARWHLLLLRLPLWGRLTRALNAERLARTLGILVSSGIPVLRALQAAARVVGNSPMRAALEEAARQVRDGTSLSRALGKSRRFPPILIHLIASGEASGRLDTMLLRAAEAQTRELEHLAGALTALLEPALTLVMGAVVLFVVLAILMPIFEINQLIRL